MSSMASSTAFFTPLHDFTQARTTPSPPLPFIKSSFASSKSTFFHPALSLQTSSNFPRLFGKPKFFSVHARAATEKTIYDFTVKEPGSNEDIKQFACTRYKAEFPIFDKVDVNGPFTTPVYQFLKSSAGGFLGDLIKWNFEKFLVDKNGKVIERYPPTTSPFQIEKDIQKLLAA
ncbi:hypothetical protein JHK87_048186 [Glycine soja]|nr:hypothetical protein JHK87_048186 [Glycine soja]